MIFENPASPATVARRGFRFAADRPMALLQRCPVYAPTPLRDMTDLAAEIGFRRLWVKDETARMRLGSFKALGGVFAIAQLVREAVGSDDPASEAAREAAGRMTFVTASAGNHGLSVAAGARIFGAHGAIVLDRNVPEGFAARIGAVGGEVIRVDGDYEDAVAHADALASDRGWLLLADGSWEGYVDRPALIMEGYTVLAEEARARFESLGEYPDHILLQAGVGGLAAAVAAHVRAFWPSRPRITVVEPDRAACLLESVRAGGLRRAVGASSCMGRLDCKDASLIAFDALRGDADAFVTVTEEAADAAARRLARHGVATTPSGAATLAALAALAPRPDETAMIIATEGPEGADARATA